MLALLSGVLFALPFYIAVRYYVHHVEVKQGVPRPIRHYGSNIEDIGFFTAIAVNVLSAIGQIIFVVLGGTSTSDSIRSMDLSGVGGVVILIVLFLVGCYMVYMVARNFKKSVETMMGSDLTQ